MPAILSPHHPTIPSLPHFLVDLQELLAHGIERFGRVPGGCGVGVPSGDEPAAGGAEKADHLAAVGADVVEAAAAHRLLDIDRREEGDAAAEPPAEQLEAHVFPYFSGKS